MGGGGGEGGGGGGGGEGGGGEGGGGEGGREEGEEEEEEGEEEEGEEEEGEEEEEEGEEGRGGGDGIRAYTAHYKKSCLQSERCVVRHSPPLAGVVGRTCNFHILACQSQQEAECNQQDRTAGQRLKFLVRFLER